MNRNILLIFLVSIFVAIIFLCVVFSLNDGESVAYAQLWEEKRYNEIILRGCRTLDKNPLDKNSLVFAGYSYFYQGMNILSSKERNESLTNSVFMLRKALLQRDDGDAPILYVLGKAYYHLGYYYTDLAIKYLEDARSGGYDAADMDEYLDLAYGRLGKARKSS